MRLKFLSVIFKLHNPSARRKEVLDRVLSQYTLAMDDILKWSEENIDIIKRSGLYRVVDKKTGEIKSEKYTEKSISKLLPSPSDVEADIASCLREAMVKDVASMVASYLELNRQDIQKAGYPISRDPSPEAWPNVLDELVFIGNDLPAENKARDKMLAIARGSFMPVPFSRSRDFAILTNINHNQFFVWLKLLPSNSDLAELIHINGDNLICVSGCNKFEPGDLFSYRGKSGLLFPVQIGQRHNDWYWQYEKFVKSLLAGEAVVKSAKLVEKQGDYFLHVSVGFEIPDRYEPETYLGIDRGVLFCTAYGIVDKQGRIIEQGHSQDQFREIRIRAGKRVQNRQQRGLRITKKDYKQRELDGILHRLVNDLLDRAVEYKSMIVMEDLNIRNVGKFYKSAYEKLARILEYKAEFRGVPVYKRRNEKGKLVPGVWAAYTSQLSICCGELSERSKDRLTLTCSRCGCIEHADEGAGVNIARRAMYRAKDWGGSNGKKGDYFAFHRSFANRQGSFDKS